MYFNNIYNEDRNIADLPEMKLLIVCIMDYFSSNRLLVQSIKWHKMVKNVDDLFCKGREISNVSIILYFIKKKKVALQLYWRSIATFATMQMTH